MSSKQKISLERAETVAEEFLRHIAKWCERKMVVGSIRRGKAWVNDIDILIIPKTRGALDIVLWAKVQKDGTRVLKMGKTGMRILYQAIQVDVYLATPESWWTLVVIRTGSAQHNIALCNRARDLKWTLHADGGGIYNERGQKISVDSEEQFFERLGLAYVPPEARD